MSRDIGKSRNIINFVTASARNGDNVDEVIFAGFTGFYSVYLGVTTDSWLILL